MHPQTLVNTGAVLLMGGSGVRCRSDTPKQFLLLGDKKVYLHTFETLKQSNLFSEIVLVVPSGYESMVKEEAPSATVVVGGKERQNSSLCGLQGFTRPIDIVLIHDALRPFVSCAILEENIKTAQRFGAANTCIASSDTLVHAPNPKIISHIPLRKDFLRGQTPQTFHFSSILHAHLHTKQKNATDDCGIFMEQGHPVHIVEGSHLNFKITTELDLILARSVYENKLIDLLIK